MPESIYVVRGQQSRKVHTDPDCIGIKTAQGDVRGPIDKSLYPNKEYCGHCSGPKPDSTPKNPKNGITVSPTVCQSCGGDLDDDGECSWCDRFEEVAVLG